MLKRNHKIGQLGQLIKSKLTLLVVKINRLIQSNMAIILEQLREAFNLDVNVLAHINAIANIDLIYPNTVLNITTNDKNEITGVEITSPQATRAVTGPVSEPAPATQLSLEVVATTETTAPLTEAMLKFQ